MGGLSDSLAKPVIKQPIGTVVRSQAMNDGNACNVNLRVLLETGIANYSTLTRTLNLVHSGCQCSRAVTVLSGTLASELKVKLTQLSGFAYWLFVLAGHENLITLKAGMES